MVPVRRAPAVIYKRRAFGVTVDRRDNDVVNTCSRCEAGEPNAAAVAG